MNRRGFLKWFGIGAAVAPIAASAKERFAATSKSLELGQPPLWETTLKRQLARAYECGLDRDSDPQPTAYADWSDCVFTAASAVIYSIGTLSSYAPGTHGKIKE